jgi:hypothetical protein
MSHKKITLLIIVTIVLVSLTFGHKIYSYVELSLNKLISISKSNENLSTEVHIGNKESSYHSKKQYPKILSHQKQNSHQLKNLQKNYCPRPLLTNITSETQSYVKADGLKGVRVIKKYYHLNTNLGINSKKFLNELNIKLNSAFQHIESQLGIKLNQAITLNLVFQTTRTDYENYVLALGRSPEGNQGIYIYPDNVSIVEIKNYEQGIKTAIHEAMHAFNQSYWGNSLRFFNEGMAEHLEAITTKGSIPKFDFSWLTHQQYPKQISTLLFSELDWHGNSRHELYQNSKALFYFLMSHEKGRQVVWKIMELEMEDPCTALPKEIIEKILFELFPNHQQEFDYWFANGLYNFLNQKQDE